MLRFFLCSNVFTLPFPSLDDLPYFSQLAYSYSPYILLFDRGIRTLLQPISRNDLPFAAPSDDANDNHAVYSTIDVVQRYLYLC